MDGSCCLSHTDHQPELPVTRMRLLSEHVHAQTPRHTQTHERRRTLTRAHPHPYTALSEGATACAS